jgi:cobalt-zinc-cadmium efflux system outer membrane protein
MWRRLAALAACLSLSGVASAQDGATLTLHEALARAADQHPELKAFGFLARQLEAERARAALAPAQRIGIEFENVPGTGGLSGVDGAEVTLSLAGVLERGGKRAAQRALAERRFDAQGVARAKAELDLAAEVAQRYLDLVGAESLAAIAGDDVAQRERAVDAAARRVQAGAAPESAQLGAEALLARARLGQRRAAVEREAAWRRLQSLWGARDSGAVPATRADVLRLPPLPEFAQLVQRLERSPELRAFADEERVREARLRIAQSAGTADVDWRVGVRRVESADGWGVVAGFSLPLDARGRAEPEVSAARAEREALTFERDAGSRRLESLLALAHGQYAGARVEVELTRDDVLPRLLRAEAAAERAYRAGALSYQEWALLQAETTAARQSQLAAALAAHRALVEIQRLTAEPILATAGNVIGDVP